MNSFVNKVAESGILSLDLEKFYPADNELAIFDMKDYLFMELILKEKDFRDALKKLDTVPFQDKIIAITCSSDAIIPMWAYMLAASILQPVAKEIFFGNKNEVLNNSILKNINAIDAEAYKDQRVVIKGCGEKPISEAAYVAITSKLRPVVKSIMYGEPCSTVPIFKKSTATV